jgi:hypothetical protein
MQTIPFLPLENSNGIVVLKVRESQAMRLIEDGLVQPIGRRRVHALRIVDGVALATVNAWLRGGIRRCVPIAEDCRTVVRVTGKSYFEHIHTEAWRPSA